ncbi:hypothetical protein CEUSTIGMA_g13240.t1 [Chlamydomonas eustigma]|uniref:Uncharacterized protein n=1 Tax=Chlamydomonas eustigma TaxID=1157962 RepID=A0A250XRZ5_9CHLO|nr:hypothetical protein CEUSTIGMA_g13240.t1 [Chlamydomonas eustigma]|eukprot:GAX85825.1 hypothetical protein CEUSTIGMA_g13240.t1 [Chlamydomonas eustigma]
MFQSLSAQFLTIGLSSGRVPTQRSIVGLSTCVKLHLSPRGNVSTLPTQLGFELAFPESSPEDNPIVTQDVSVAKRSVLNSIYQCLLKGATLKQVASADEMDERIVIERKKTTTSTTDVVLVSTLHNTMAAAASVAATGRQKYEFCNDFGDHIELSHQERDMHMAKMHIAAELLRNTTTTTITTTTTSATINSAKMSAMTGFATTDVMLMKYFCFKPLFIKKA